MAIIKGVIGILFLLGIAYLLSTHKKAIRWKTIFIGLSLQFILAFGVLRVEWVKSFFNVLGGFFTAVLEFTESGSAFLFGNLINVSEPAIGYVFAFQILPTIVFFSALTSILYYLGVVQKIVSGLAWLLTKTLKISGAESLSVAGNIFLGQTEAPLLIKAYLAKMNRSEVMLVMTGGMATVAGGVLASYVGFLGGTDPELRLSFARHLIAASVMAAPGAIIIAKLMVPQTEPIDEKIEVSDTEVGSNALDALSNGTTEGLKLALNVGAMLLVFIAFIAMINGILTGVGDLTGINDWIAANSSYTELSLESILGTIFAPLMYIIGVASEDLNLMGQLLGIKLVASEFVAYTQLAELKNMAAAVHLTYDKSVLMATYMLCGFANFASIGIQIGGIGTIAPSQKKTLSELGFRALIAGSLASLLSATIAGMILG
ncbi:MAG: nucleoside transporter C-terminal domain-containing protein [Flavobacteriaceae bacterium]|jgi:CNT family concentrative nucleoside transporter